jgi:hypothetical protein
LIIIGVVVILFGLNQLAKTMNISSDVFEMTEKQQTALDNQTESIKDTISFRPVLPQADKAEEAVDIIEDMKEYHRMDVSFPIKLDIFPKETLSYRHEMKNSNPLEDFIMKNTPKSLFFSKPGRVIFYNTQNTRFVISGFAFREKEISRVVFEINDDRELIIYIR